MYKVPDLALILPYLRVLHYTEVKFKRKKGIGIKNRGLEV